MDNSKTGYLVLGAEKENAFLNYNLTTTEQIGERTTLPLIASETSSLDDIVLLSASNQPNGTGPCDVNNGGCSQHCFRTSSTSSVCVCSFGYQLKSDNVSCVTSPTPFSSNTSFLLVVDKKQNSVYQYQPTTDTVYTLHRNAPDYNILPVAVAIDAVSGDLYVATLEHSGGSTINRLRKRTLDASAVYSATIDEFDGTSGITDIVLDHTRSLLYYADYQRGFIGQLDSLRTNQRKIVVGNATGVTALALDTINRRLYWSDGSTGRPVIQSCDANDGTDRRTVYIDKQTLNITGIVVHSESIYWTTQRPSSLFMASLNGTGVTSLYSDSRDASYVGLALIGDYVYIADSFRGTLLTISLKTRRLTEHSPMLFSEIVDVASYDLTAGIGNSNVEPDPQQQTSDNKVALIVGLVVGLGGGLLIITAAVIVAIVVYRKRVVVETASRCTTVYAEITDGDMVMANVSQSCANIGYESLQRDKEAQPENNYSECRQTSEPRARSQNEYSSHVVPGAHMSSSDAADYLHIE